MASGGKIRRHCGREAGLGYCPTNNGSGRRTVDMAVVDSLVVFVVGLLIGALGIYLGARVLRMRSMHHNCLSDLSPGTTWGRP